ncbi:MAG: enoyl-CoA hydratase/isomerase family protein [Candidatus Latescibacterota bacterium]|nr:MAG: enoyl-CoA hydratase/isomerase family protein [Candidatus Latescibacterota bacterium]
MSRPDVHNAFNEHLIADLSDAFREIARNVDAPDPVRVVVYTGEGKSFSAGADLNWMKKMVDYTFEENMEDSLALAELMHLIYTCPVPTIARVNGAAIGGGVGLLSACDVAVASDKATFSLSEVKLGIVPACIAPYVIGRIGQRAAREFFLTGERFDADKALEIGLVNRVAPHDKLDKAVGEFADRLITSGPQALKMAKELIREVPGMSPDTYKKYTAEMIARLRISDEGQEGMRAFFEKRKPSWAEEDKKRS